MLQVVWGEGGVRTTTCASGEEKGGRGLFSAVGKTAREGGIYPGVLEGHSTIIEALTIDHSGGRGAGGHGAGGQGDDRCEW